MRKQTETNKQEQAGGLAMPGLPEAREEPLDGLRAPLQGGRLRLLLGGGPGLGREPAALELPLTLQRLRQRRGVVPELLGPHRIVKLVHEAETGGGVGGVAGAAQPGLSRTPLLLGEGEVQLPGHRTPDHAGQPVHGAGGLDLRCLRPRGILGTPLAAEAEGDLPLPLGVLQGLADALGDLLRALGRGRSLPLHAKVAEVASLEPVLQARPVAANHHPLDAMQLAEGTLVLRIAGLVLWGLLPGAVRFQRGMAYALLDGPVVDGRTVIRALGGAGVLLIVLLWVALQIPAGVALVAPRLHGKEQG
eukprot:766212-Hanusia_phi.AAC.3